jgi:hypothetical protein
MSIRFRRSVRLFPGVRLNFSGSGVSTTVGVRGASVTVGARGAYLNAGLRGTGLSYRTRLHAPAPRPRTFVGAPAGAVPEGPFATPEPPGSGQPGEIRSADLSVLTSPGLGELKRLINEATIKRRELTSAVAADRRNLDAAERKLSFARSFIIRIFTRRSIPRLASTAAQAQANLADRAAELEGCVIQVDVAFDEATHSSYAALVRAFEGASRAHRIWDVTAQQVTDRIKERTTAATSVSRTPAPFDYTVPEIVASRFQAMRLGNASGAHLYLYPGFLMVRDGSGDFALLEYKDVDAQFAPSPFIEEETPPADAEVIGQTWKWANKDGSPDRRFNGNYPIPILRYGKLVLRSPTGLHEAYLVSDAVALGAFCQAFSNHQRALAQLAKTPPPPTADLDPDPEDQLAQGEEAAHVVDGAHEVAPRSLVLDWIALAAIVIALTLATNWIVHYQPPPHQPPPPSVVAPQPKPPSSAPHHKAGPHKARHHLRSASSAAGGPPPAEVTTEPEAISAAPPPTAGPVEPPYE